MPRHESTDLDELGDSNHHGPVVSHDGPFLSNKSQRRADDAWTSQDFSAPPYRESWWNQLLRRFSSRITVRGTVRNTAYRSVWYHVIQMDLWHFSIEHIESGQSMPVRMEGWRIYGQLVDGAKVEVIGHLTKDNVLVAEQVRFLETPALMRPVGLKIVALPIALYGASILITTYSELARLPNHPLYHDLSYRCLFLAQALGLGIVLRFLLKL